MSRLVEAVKVQKGAAPLVSGGDATWKNYGIRVAKYIPAEVNAFYSAAVQLISADSDPNHAVLRSILFSAALVGGLIATPIYLGLYSKNKATSIPNQLIGTIAFSIWAYAYPAGIFNVLGVYIPVIGGFLLLVFTLSIGKYVPTEEVPAQDPASNASGAGGSTPHVVTAPKGPDIK